MLEGRLRAVPVLSLIGLGGAGGSDQGIGGAAASLCIVAGGLNQSATRRTRVSPGSEGLLGRPLFTFTIDNSGGLLPGASDARSLRIPDDGGAHDMRCMARRRYRRDSVVAVPPGCSLTWRHYRRPAMALRPATVGLTVSPPLRRHRRSPPRCHAALRPQRRVALCRAAESRRAWWYDALIGGLTKTGERSLRLCRVAVRPITHPRCSRHQATCGLSVTAGSSGLVA